MRARHRVRPVVDESSPVGGRRAPLRRLGGFRRSAVGERAGLASLDDPDRVRRSTPRPSAGSNRSACCTFSTASTDRVRSSGFASSRPACNSIASAAAGSPIARASLAPCSATKLWYGRAVGGVSGVSNRVEDGRCVVELVAFEMYLDPCHPRPDPTGLVDWEAHAVGATFHLGSELDRPAEVPIERGHQRRETGMSNLVGQRVARRVGRRKFQCGPRRVEVAGLDVGPNDGAEDQWNETLVGWTTVDGVETRLRMPKGILRTPRCRGGARPTPHGAGLRARDRVSGWARCSLSSHQIASSEPDIEINPMTNSATSFGFVSTS